MTAFTGGTPPLLLPPGFARAAAGLPEKELRRLDDALARLHAVNSRLWRTEDRVRAVGLSADRVAVFLRCRYTQRRGTDRRESFSRRNP